MGKYKVKRIGLRIISVSLERGTHGRRGRTRQQHRVRQHVHTALYAADVAVSTLVVTFFKYIFSLWPFAVLSFSGRLVLITGIQGQTVRASSQGTLILNFGLAAKGVMD